MGLFNQLIARHRSTQVQYKLSLSEINKDFASITDATLNTDVPSTGDWAYGGSITVPTINPVGISAGLFGKSILGNRTYRYNMFITNTGDLSVIGYLSETLTISNFISTYGGQTKNLKAQYEGLDIVCYINNVEVGRMTLTARPTQGQGTSYFIGASAVLSGLAPADDRYFDGVIHSFFIGTNTWGVNEGSGYSLFSTGTNYEAIGQTSNSGGLTYWDNNVWKLVNPIKFVSTWETTGALETIQLPVTYNNYTIDWGDGTVTTTGTSHEYATANQYVIRIEGEITDFVSVNGDKDKLISIENWGGFRIGSSSFSSCSNLVKITAQDTPSIISILYRCFRACVKLESITNLENWDFTLCTSLFQTWRDCFLFNSSFGVNNTTLNVTIMGGTFISNLELNQDISGLNYSSVNDLTLFMTGKTAADFDAVHYDALLQKWDSQLVFANFSNVNIDMGTILHTGGASAITARLNLINKGFLIADGHTI